MKNMIYIDLEVLQNFAETQHSVWDFKKILNKPYGRCYERVRRLKQQGLIVHDETRKNKCNATVIFYCISDRGKKVLEAFPNTKDRKQKK